MSSMCVLALPIRQLLTVHFQTELAISTHVVVSDVHQGVTNTHVIVSKLEQNVADIHRTIVTGQDGSDGKTQSVGATCTPSVSESALTVPQTQPRSATSIKMGP